MIWLITVASLLGFLAVDTLVDQPLIANYDEKTWLVLVVALSIMLVGSLALTHWLHHKFRKNLKTNYGFKVRLLFCLLSSLVFLITLLLSASDGLYQYQRYQRTLLKAPITVDAIVKSYQISDKINQTIQLANNDYLIGDGYARQLLQVIPKPDSNADKDSVATPQSLTVLVSANVKDHPDWQTTLAQLTPGQQLNVKLQLQPIHHYQNPILPKNVTPLNLGFDEAQWLRQRGVQAKGTLLAIDQNSLSDFIPTNFTDAFKLPIEKLRWQLRQKILLSVHQTLIKQSIDLPKATNLDSLNPKYQQRIQYDAILLGLLTGDKGLMDSQLKNLYQVTGISHLLAISGPHVLMLATLVSMVILWLVKLLIPKLLVRLPSRLLVLWVSVIVAGFYAMLVGFEIPAQRTFWMLLLLTISKQLLFRLSAYRLLAWVALGMLWLDTTAISQAGFWLSFIAVMLLLKFSEQIGTNATFEFNSADQLSKINLPPTLMTGVFTLVCSQLKQLLVLQIWLFVWMLPIVIWFFGKVSLMGIIVNLVAVPLLGLVIVPLDMLAGIVSWLPVIGDWLSQAIWSLLAFMLSGFHWLLNQLVDLGFAKQSFLALSQAQLTICALIGVIWFLRGLLPRMLILPLVILLVIIPIEQQAQNNSAPMLAVMDSPTMGISLLKKGHDSWLIVADNQVEQTKATKPSFMTKRKPATSLSADEDISALLTGDIYPLLANQHISQLTGVISQTPSSKVNQLVQQLATQLPIKHYWLAGYEAVTTTIRGREDISSTNFRVITPKNCQSAQAWQQDGLEVKAVSGWHLDLPLNAEEKLATQTCFIQISYVPPTGKAYHALLAAGNSEIPMQMAEKLCTVSAANLLIQPYRTPVKQPWLAMTKPTLLHVLTGEYDYQKLAEDSQLSLASWQADVPLQVMYADQVGGLVYSLNPSL